MTSLFTRVNVEMRYAEPARTPPYGRWTNDACPRPATAIEARRLVIRKRRGEIVQLYDSQNTDISPTEHGIKVRVTDHYREMWIDWAYYMPQTHDLLAWEYVNRSGKDRFEVIGICT